LATTRALAQASAELRFIESTSYHNRRPRHRLESLAQALDPWIDLVRRTEIKNEHMVIPAVDHLFEPTSQLGTPRRTEPALEDGEPDHAKGLIAHRSRAREQRLMMHFLGLIYPADAVARALSDGLAFQALSAEYITNILETRALALPEPGPLQLTRRHDLLDTSANSTPPMSRT
jgi:hypothetical protein